MIDFLVHHLLRTTASRYGDREAWVHRITRRTYEEAWSDCAAAASGLRDIGVEKHDRIAIWLPHCVEQAASIFATSAAGAVFVPLHESLFPRQIAHVAGDCQIRAMITRRQAWESIRRANISLPSVQQVVLTDCQPADADFAGHIEVISWNELLSRGLQRPWAERPMTDRDLAAILYTSGSTGLPKGVMLSHANVIAGTSIVSDYLAIRRHDRILAALPFSFDAGLNQLTTGVQQGAAVVMLSFVLAKQLVDVLHSERITALAGVPMLWNLLVRNSLFRTSRFPELRYITNTGGALPISTLDILRETLTDTEIVLMYGLTEAFRSTYLPPDQLAERPTSIGRAIPNTEIFVVDEHGNRCRPGEVGELVHHGPTVSLGYWGQPELTDQVLRPHPFPPEGLQRPPTVCYSGDLVRQDTEGYLYFVARRDHQIKTSGFRVSPGEIEEVLHLHPQVNHAAVIGVPDELIGQQIVAFVVTSTDDDEVASAVHDHCATQLPAYMVPKRIVIVPQLPQTSRGKVDYAALEAQATESQ